MSFVDQRSESIYTIDFEACSALRSNNVIGINSAFVWLRPVVDAALAFLVTVASQSYNVAEGFLGDNFSLFFFCFV